MIDKENKFDLITKHFPQLFMLITLFITSESLF